MEVIGVLCMQKDAVFLAECSLDRYRHSNGQNAIQCFYCLEYTEAVFAFTEEDIDKVKYVGCFLWGSSGCCLGRSMQSSQQNAIECFYSLEYIEAGFSFTEEIIDKVKSVGCLLWDSSGCCLGRSMQSIQQNAVQSTSGRLFSRMQLMAPIPQSTQKQVHPAECSLEHEWLSILQNAVERFDS